MVSGDRSFPDFQSNKTSQTSVQPYKSSYNLILHVGENKMTFCCLPTNKLYLDQLGEQRMKLPIIFSLCLLSAQVMACPNDCSNNGYCLSTDKCSCYPGYFGNDCSDGLLDTHRDDTIALQVIIGFAYFVLALFCAKALYHSLQRTHALVLVSNVRSIVFGIILVIATTEGLYAGLDPWSFYFMPRLANVLLHCVQFPLGVIAFTAILFHWIEVVHTSIKSMKKEYMMQNINKNYKGKDVTLEEMVERVKFLQNLKIPFGIFLVVLTVAVFVLEILAFFSPESKSLLRTIMFIMVMICWLFLIFGYLIYGRRLIKLMPFQLTKKVTRLTRRLTMLSAFVLLCYIVIVPIVMIVKLDNKTAVLAQFAVIEILTAFDGFAMCFLFLHWKKKFPFVSFSQTTSQSSGGVKTPTGTSATLEIVEIPSTPAQPEVAASA